MAETAKEYAERVKRYTTLWYRYQIPILEKSGDLFTAHLMRNSLAIPKGMGCWQPFILEDAQLMQLLDEFEASLITTR